MRTFAITLLIETDEFNPDSLLAVIVDALEDGQADEGFQIIDSVVQETT